MYFIMNIVKLPQLMIYHYNGFHCWLSIPFFRATFFGLMLPGILASLAYLGMPVAQVEKYSSYS